MWEEIFLGASRMDIVTHASVNRSTYQPPVKRWLCDCSAWAVFRSFPQGQLENFEIVLSLVENRPWARPDLRAPPLLSYCGTISLEG